MRFGFGPVAAAPSGSPPASPGRGACEDAIWSQDEGFDSIWLEPGAQTAGASPVVLGAAVARAARAHRIVVRPVIGVTHPVNIAEELATLDVISYGRAVLATCDRPPSRTLDATGLTPAEAIERFWEALEIIQRAWSPEPFSFEGSHWRVPARMPEHADSPERLSVTPKPAQLTIPILVGATTPESIGRAAEAGLPVLGEAWETLSEVTAKFEHHREYGAPAAARRLRAVVRDVFVAETAKRAWQIAEAELERGYGRDRADGRALPGGSTREVAAERAVVGDTDGVLEELRRYAAAGVNYVACRIAAPAEQPHLAREAATLLGRGVAPHLKMFGLPEAIRVRTLHHADSPVLPLLEGTI